MIKRLLMTAAFIAAAIGMTTGFSVVPANASSTSLPAYITPGNFHSLAETQAQPAYKIYVVKSGNTLSGIASHFDLNWKKLYCANRGTIGKEPSLIQPKMRLKIRESEHVWCAVPNTRMNPVSVTTVSAVQYTGTINYSGFGSFQQCVIQRESGGDPTAINPYSGASGLYGFLLSTWMGTPYGAQYSGGAYTAPVSVQNSAFAWVYARDGTSPWAPYDGC